MFFLNRNGTMIRPPSKNEKNIDNCEDINAEKFVSGWSENIFSRIHETHYNNIME